MTENELHKLSAHPHFIFTLRIQDPDDLECLLQDSRLLEHAVGLSRGKMTRLYRELRGMPHQKACFPFHLTGL